MNEYPYFFEWATGQSHPTAHPTAERVIELSTDRKEYEFQFAALLALAEDKSTMNTPQDLAALLLKETQERMIADGLSNVWQNFITKVHTGKKYTRIDVGPSNNMSGRYMIENETGAIYGIKAYGVIHRGHYYGTLDTIHDYFWGGYTAVKKRK